MKSKVKKWSLFTIRWGIAIAGIWFVLSNITLHDTVYVLSPDKTRLEARRLAAKTADPTDFDFASIIDPKTGQTIKLPRADLFTEADVKKVLLFHTENGHRALVGERKLLALQLRRDLGNAHAFVIADEKTGKGEIAFWYDPAHGIDTGISDYHLQVARPTVQTGLLTLINEARTSWLWLALAIFPITYIITSWRWHALLNALDIHLTLARTFVLNMVGAFYNTFMPGSTGGDVLKAYYASRQTVHRTRAVMSVFVDRILGLLALVLLGGVMAFYEWFRVTHSGAGHTNDVARICLKVAIVSVSIFVIVIAGLTIYYTPLLRRIAGLDWIIFRLPMQKQVANAMEVMEIYRKRPGLILWAMIATLPVHIAVALSALFAGHAFNLPISDPYYFVAVPVIVLMGSIPISPQGAGVMEFVAVKLTAKYGANVSQAFALAMSIRLVQIFWNLTGGLFVLRGGYHAPTAAEQTEMNTDVPGVTPQAEPAAAPTPTT